LVVGFDLAVLNFVCSSFSKTLWGFSAKAAPCVEMKLVPREVEKLALHNAGFLAQKRLARGLRLNYTEAVALIAAQVSEDEFVITDCASRLQKVYLCASSMDANVVGTEDRGDAFLLIPAL
jgi:hypothetical protein